LTPVYTLAKLIVCTPGNLTTITATVKTGKSAVIGAMMASALGEPGGEYLGFASKNPDGRALLHFDSEQSPDDHWRVVDTALARSGWEIPPRWLRSYCLTGLNHETAWDCIRKAIRWADEDYGGLHSILLDGVADLVANVNDPAECNDFVAELQGSAIKYNCPIICVIHFNPGTEKTRGHLGSQLERKAETNLRLDKDENEITTIWSNKQRRAPITQSHGPRFGWDEERQMHVANATLAESKEDLEREELQEIVLSLLGDGQKLTYSALTSAIEKGLRVKTRTAQTRIKNARNLGIIKRDEAGLYGIGT
jgi:hypothetical protein